jgi:serine/threonine protein kinase
MWACVLQPSAAREDVGRIAYRTGRLDVSCWVAGAARVLRSAASCRVSGAVTIKTLLPEPELDSSRYELVRPLGEGAAGAVFLAIDRETGEQLALKKLFRMDQKTVLRLKREFRSLAKLNHPNLIKLYDLSRGPDAWFLTMEFVDGIDLRSQLANMREPLAPNPIDAAPQFDPARIARLCELFHQLACGVRAVHQAGMLHRDLKPSNVMVARDGRVVVLDFGLVRGLDDEVQVTQDDMIAGTPAYMPPEQAAGEPLSEASDWYAFGAMLYEALSGRLPIEGRSALALMQRKLNSDPPPLQREADGPRELRTLCMAMLERTPGRRPTGEQILELLASLIAERPQRERTLSEELLPANDVTSGFTVTALVGRDAELQQLRAAFAQVQSGRTAVVHVRGTSGSGKSSLIEHFLDELHALEPGGLAPALVLRSRCYEREAMPFKALDGAMDALVQDLARLDDLDVAHLLPAAVAELTQLFPVLERLNAVQRLARDPKPSGDAAEIRRRAEQALRELMQRLAARRPLVIFIDDLQWGDLDSGSVLKTWLSQPLAAPVMLLFSYRSEEVATSSCLELLLENTERASGAPRDVVLELSPLGDAEVRALCVQRLSGAPQLPAGLIVRIVAEAQGNPFLAQQLTALAFAKLVRGDAELGTLSVEEVVLHTSSLLLPAARDLLNALAIAGRPLAPQLALRAAGIRQDGRAHIHALQGLRLLRTRDVGGRRLLEVYHDRVREAVQASLSAAERQELNMRLLRVAESTRPVDPDWLHALALGADQTALAFSYGLLAADRANASLAFERAAELYGVCLGLNADPNDAVDLWVRLATALARCRRGAKAAEAYLEASKRATAAEQVPLLQLAASHFLRSGRFEQGEQLVRRVLAALHFKVPTSQAGQIAAIAWERMRIGLMGEVIPAAIGTVTDERTVREAELYGVLALETQQYQPLRAALFEARALRLALVARDPTLTARSLCLSAAIACLTGTPRAERETAGLLDRAQGLAEQLGSANLHVEVLSARALCGQLLGRPADVLEPSYAADRIYETRVSGGVLGDYYYMFAVHIARVGALQSLGHHTRATEELRGYLERARATDNRAAILHATLPRTTSEQMIEQCAHSRARLDAERAEHPREGVGIIRVCHMIAVMRAACTTRDFDWALAQSDDWQAYLRSPIHRSAYLAALAHNAHARLLLNHHVANGQRRGAERVLRADLRQLERLPPMRVVTGALARLRARLDYLAGDPAAALERLRRNAVTYEAAGFLDEFERERYAVGYLIGGEEGAQLKAAADLGLRKLGVSEPLRDLRGYFPELVDAPG